MKINHIIFSLSAASLLLVGCYDEKMDWYTPDGHGAVVSSEIPLQLAEKIANYDYIKNYAVQYMPETKIGLGFSADKYLSDEAYAAVADANFQIFTPGNAMKHQVAVNESGELNVGPGSTIQQFITKANDAGIEIFGHNFIWHTQQQQDYLYSLIKPEAVMHNDGDGNLLNTDVLNQGSFGTWDPANKGAGITIVDGKGMSGGKAIQMVASSSSSDDWNLQLITHEINVTEGHHYHLTFNVRSEQAGFGRISFQNLTSNYPWLRWTASQTGVTKGFDTSTEWLTIDIDLPDPAATASFFKCQFDFGTIPNATYYIDINTLKLTDLDAVEDKPTNYCPDGSFENGGEGWTFQNKGAGMEVVDLADAVDGKKVLKMTSSSESSEAYNLQALSPDMETMPGKKIVMSFWIKSDKAGKGRVSFAGLKNNYPWMPWLNPNGSWSEAFATTTDWQQVSLVVFNYNDNDFADGASTWHMAFDFGYLPDVTYYLDDVRIEEYVDEAAAKTAKKATTFTYNLKSAEEKREALLGAMKQWIEGMAAACPTVKQWDVVNEPIADGNHKWRGFDGTFGMEGDSTPTESEAEGLKLNWVKQSGNSHFYWGYYIGRDYAAKAFEYARAAIGEGAKLYVNEYGLESSEGKTDALIDFVNYIDQNGAKVDGIGTQMHITLYGTNNDAANNAEKVAELKEKVDKMFKKLAATGKLVRVSELDIAFGTTNGEEVSPSTAQYQAQADAYRVIVESYKENVPAAQRGGFCIWTLSDAKDEHEYWLKGDKPNLFDKDYARKIAYKGVCDGIAGYDVSQDFDGTMWNK